MTEKEQQFRTRLILGVSGASGAIYAQRLLHQVQNMPVETHLVVSRAGRLTVSHELGSVEALGAAHHTWPIGDIAAPIASGSFRTAGMIIAPCSVRTMSEIASGVTSSLLTRAADVCLKERRPLVLMVRETPFHLGHLRTMTQLTEMGAIIAPPLPAFYTKPDTITDLVDQSAARALELVGLSSDRLLHWGEDMNLAGRKSDDHNSEAE